MNNNIRNNFGSVPSQVVNPSMVSTVSKTGINQIDSILSGVKWGTNNVTFSFPMTKTDYTGYTGGSELDSNFKGLNTMQKNAARTALASWENVCNLKFSETTGGNGTIRFGTTGKAPTSWAYYPSTQDNGGDVWFGNSNANSPTNPVVGSYSYATYVHEIGHALGLKHPHDTSGTVANGNIDSVEFSIMSYRSYVGAGLTGYTISNESFPVGPMMDDIAAIQQMYGANYNYNSGDSVYKFDPNQTKIFETIWDGGGKDTYDLSAYKTDVKVDLRPGAWSNFGAKQLASLGSGHYAQGNVANALLYNGDTRSLIENAIGGSGNDTLIGNQLDNQLDGGFGADYMVGGAGNDTYVVDNLGDVVVENAGEGIDTIYSKISVNALGANLENLVLYGNDNLTGAGNELDNVIRANNGNDKLYGGAGNDILYAGAGNDVLDGGLGNDTYVIGVGCGNDMINSYVGNNSDNGFDTLQFQNMVFSDISFVKNANDLICTIGQTGKTIDIGNWFLGANYQVDQFLFADRTLTAMDVSQKLA